jgi:magnesium chelatase family protein
LAMSTTIKSIISRGATGLTVDIECHLSNSLPGIVIVGAGSRSVDEAKERLRGAFSSSGLHMPRKRIIINLAPADIPKESSSLDLPMALAILKAAGIFPTDSLADDNTALCIGELGLDGRVRPVRGIIGKLLAARDLGFECFYIPADNLQQARMIPGLRLVPITHLSQLVAYASGTEIPSEEITDRHTAATAVLRAQSQQTNHATRLMNNLTTLDDIVGQEQAKRALQIAAAGGHNILFNGSPGTGKSMLAKTLASLLPPLSHEEMLEATHLHSLSSNTYDQLITSRPVRAPHHTASRASIVGGGNTIKPGEISLAHRGVLLFDELPEFGRDIIEALRQPLEDRTITISRARESAEFPANFIFAATANPCPCGKFTPSPQTLTAITPAVKRQSGKYSRNPQSEPPTSTNTILCDCPPALVNQYQRKLSGPLLDRIDLLITVEPVAHNQLLAAKSTPVSDYNTSIIRLVTQARRLQQERFGNAEFLNAHMSNRQIKQYAQLSAPASELLQIAAANLNLSARGYMRCIKVARTVADLSASPTIEPEHLTEALRYRPQ